MSYPYIRPRCPVCKWPNRDGSICDDCRDEQRSIDEANEAEMRRRQKDDQEDAERDVSPFTTPGTRLVWGSGKQWRARWEELKARHCSSKNNRDRESHIEELAKHPAFIAAQPAEDLEAIKLVLAENKPPKGQRAGTPYELILNEANNALQRLAAAEQRCECGAAAATWHGDLLRVFCCDPCWTRHEANQWNVRELADVPFALTPTHDRRKGIQKELF